MNLGKREIEIYRWTNNEPGQTPAGYTGLVIRAGLDYKNFAAFRTGERKRALEYKAHKTAGALKLVKMAEGVLPGLSDAIELMKAATPLTYQDWAHRYQGSIASWNSNGAGAEISGRKLLVETPLSSSFHISTDSCD